MGTLSNKILLAALTAVLDWNNQCIVSFRSKWQIPRQCHRQSHACVKFLVKPYPLLIQKVNKGALDVVQYLVAWYPDSIKAGAAHPQGASTSRCVAAQEAYAKAR
jgi:hypothetical protein